MSPLKYSNYKEYLRDLLKDKGTERGFQSQMAKAMNCQAAYLSQTLRGKVELTEDHALKLTLFLKLNPLESEYFILLLRLSRAATPELRQYLEEKRVELAAKEEDLNNKVRAKSARDSEAFMARYFASWVPLTLHVATSSPHLQTVEKLAERFHLSPAVVEENLFFLEEYNLVKREGKRFKFSGESIHLPKTSSLHGVYQVNQRTQAIRSIHEKDKNSLHFSSVFTIDKKSYKDLLEICNKAIEDTHKVIHESGTEEVYSINLDLFRVV
jgi:uncharacterized protein (TIGR02147 family)